ncbi:MAG: glutamine--fructose-6-phosphate aminotransferase, partial [Ruminococcaceae bacterium]|nr:glutamine--fructose-6-phosphate aminotransferase [Oscillospiraceae bacterium]
MCGIVGFSGKRPSVPILLDGLKKLEYRGYDSAGIAVIDDGNIEVVKAKGRLSNLKQKLETMKSFEGSTCGIGHTRWATHGEPSDVNSHPHSSSRV